MNATVSTTPQPTIMDADANANTNDNNAGAEGLGILTPTPTPPPSLSVQKAGEDLPPRPSKASIVSAVSPISIPTAASASAVASSPVASSAVESVAVRDGGSNESLLDEVAKVKKVNFWGWVDVGFSHGVDDYDRTPIETDPLTREGAIEVLQMRLEMRRATQELLQWRAEYERAVHSSSGLSALMSEDDSSDFSDEPTENNENNDQEHDDDNNSLRRTKSTPRLHHNRSSQHQKLSARETLQQRFPPVAPDASSVHHATSNATALYPHPKYPTHLLPRRRQSVSAPSTSTTLSTTPTPPHPAPPKRMQSTPVSATDYPTVSTTPTTSAIITTATSPPFQQQSPVPVPRLRAAGSKILAPWPILERPHSHAGTNSQTLPSPSAATASLPPRPNPSSPLQQQQPPVPPASARRRDPSFTAQQAQHVASGARWTWNESLARDHQKNTTQEQQDAVFAAHEHLAALALSPPQQLLHPSRDSVPSLADSRPSSTNSSTTTTTAVAAPEKEKYSSSVLGGLVGFWKNDKS